jgi:MFS family permease
MREGLGATLTQAQWINNGYLLPLSALILLGGALGDRFGVARAFGAGIVVFVIASLLCAIAPTPETMIAGRVLKGIGAAAMIPGSLALIARAYPRADRGRAIGIWAAASALTTALGPSSAAWRSASGARDLAAPLRDQPAAGALALWLLWHPCARGPSRPPNPARLARRGIDQRALAALAYGLTGARPGRLAPPQRGRARVSRGFSGARRAPPSP